jgi:hypothetical protein
MTGPVENALNTGIFTARLPRPTRGKRLRILFGVPGDLADERVSASHRRLMRSL